MSAMDVQPFIATVWTFQVRTEPCDDLMREQY